MSEEQGQGELGQFTPPDPPDEQQLAIDEAMAHEAYLDPSHPLHKVQMAKVQSLFQAKYPEPQRESEFPPGGPVAPSAGPQPPAQPPTHTPGLEGVKLPPMPKGITWDTEALQEFAGIAREIGLGNEELQMELEAFSAGMTRWDKLEFDEETGLAALELRWGDNAANIVDLAQEFIASLPDATKAKLTAWLDKGWGNHPSVIEGLARRGQKLQRTES